MKSNRFYTKIVIFLVATVGLLGVVSWLSVEPSTFIGSGTSPAFARVSGQTPSLNENCTVSILNRTVQVNPDGSFEIPNIPADAGLVRVTVLCNDNGLTTGGRSEFFAPIQNGTVVIRDIPLGVIPPSPESLSISANPTTLTTPGDDSRITVIANFPDGSVQDVTPRSEGTTYVSSNPDVATVDNEGLVTADGTSGNAFISVRHDGLIGTIGITVILDDDSDADGMPNDYEDSHSCLDSNVPDDTSDPDGDGLTNIEEFNLGTDPCFADSDGDGLSDWDEVNRGTAPLLADSDFDGLTDGDEVNVFGSNPLNNDSDADGLPDGIEVAIAGNPFGANPFVDNDGDGLSNLDEVQLFTDPTNPDTDFDGLTDGEEVTLDTDPLDPDTDDDGFSDGFEVALGSDPTNLNSLPDTTYPSTLVVIGQPVSALNTKSPQ